VHDVHDHRSTAQRMGAMLESTLYTA
jgi:hypothetical protein